MTLITTTIQATPILERWRLLAACRDEPVDIFFPTQAESSRISPIAHSICRTCPVKVACLEYALARNVYGFWGDTSEKERRRIKKERRLQLLSQQSQPRLDGQSIAV